MIILQALWGSFWVKAIGMTFAALLAVKAYGLAREWQGEAKGEARAYAKVESKSNADNKVADAVREKVASGRRGKPDPYGVR